MPEELSASICEPSCTHSVAQPSDSNYLQNRQVTKVSLIRTTALLSFGDWGEGWTNYSVGWMRRRGNFVAEG